MKTIATGLRSTFSGERVSTALCWLVTKSTGGAVRGTEHDKDIEITTGVHAGTYVSISNISGADIRSTSDLSVDNTEVESVGEENGADGITFDEIEAGVIDGAEVIVFLCNWRAPDDGQVILRRGYMGNVTRDSDDRLQTEVRGLAQLLVQQIGKVLTDRCDVARFGDTRCKFDVDAITSSGTVTIAPNRKTFTVAFGSQNWDMLPPGGEVTFTSGDNNGFTKEVKSVTDLGGGIVEIEVYEEMAADVAVADTLDLVPGCDRLYTTCKARSNLVNFRGHGVFVPGVLAMMRGPNPGDCNVTLPTESSSSP